MHILHPSFLRFIAPLAASSLLAMPTVPLGATLGVTATVAVVEIAAPATAEARPSNRRQSTRSIHVNYRGRTYDVPVRRGQDDRAAALEAVYAQRLRTAKQADKFQTRRSVTAVWSPERGGTVDIQKWAR